MNFKKFIYAFPTAKERTWEFRICFCILINVYIYFSKNQVKDLMFFNLFELWLHYFAVLIPTHIKVTFIWFTLSTVLYFLKKCGVKYLSIFSTKSREWVETCFQVCIADLGFHTVCFCLRVCSYCLLCYQKLSCLNIKTASEQNGPGKKGTEISSGLLLLHETSACWLYWDKTIVHALQCYILPKIGVLKAIPLIFFFILEIFDILMAFERLKEKIKTCIHNLTSKDVSYQEDDSSSKL